MVLQAQQRYKQFEHPLFTRYLLKMRSQLRSRAPSFQKILAITTFILWRER
jgi:hypothetical protein